MDQIRRRLQARRAEPDDRQARHLFAALPPYPAHLANDGIANNTDRYWATDVASDEPAWWQVDLEEPTTVGRVVVVGYYGDERYYGFTVETSLDGKARPTLQSRPLRQ